MPDREENLRGIFAESGYWWPAGCAGKTSRWLRHERDSDFAVRLIPKWRRRTAVQAGGSMGLWPLRLAEKFERVVTFEPDEAAWECLQRNCQNQPKIKAHHALLGERPGLGTLLYNAKNAGGHKCRFDGVELDESARRAFVGREFSPVEGLPVMAIDQMALEDVDLIYLDIEGAEFPAFRGALETMRRCRPVIAYEEREHGLLHGYTPQDLDRWLRSVGYTFHSRIAKDRIWAPC